MTSIAETLLTDFGLNPSFRPAKSEDILISLICTLQEGGLLGKALLDIQERCDLDYTGDRQALEILASYPDIALLFRQPKAVSILLHVKPLLIGKDVMFTYKLPPEILDQFDASKQANRLALQHACMIVNRLDINGKIAPAFGGDFGELLIFPYADRERIMADVALYNLPETLVGKLL